MVEEVDKEKSRFGERKRNREITAPPANKDVFKSNPLEPLDFCQSSSLLLNCFPSPWLQQVLLAGQYVVLEGSLSTVAPHRVQSCNRQRTPLCLPVEEMYELCASEEYTAALDTSRCRHPRTTHFSLMLMARREARPATIFRNGQSSAWTYYASEAWRGVSQRDLDIGSCG